MWSESAQMNAKLDAKPNVATHFQDETAIILAVTHAIFLKWHCPTIVISPRNHRSIYNFSRLSSPLTDKTKTC